MTRQRSMAERFWAWWLQSNFQRSWARVGCQASACTFLVLAVFSAPAAWNALSLDPVLANPSLILVLSMATLLFGVGSGLSAPQIAFETTIGTLIGCVLQLGVCYLVFAICGGAGGGGYDNTPTKAALTILFGSSLLFVVGASRFKYRQHNVCFLIMAMTVGVGLAGTYHMPDRLWRFVCYWLAFIGISQAITLAVAALVLPTPAGGTVRNRLDKALRLQGQLMGAVVALMTSELDETTGLLAAASGKASQTTGVDSGLEEGVAPAHAASLGASMSMQTATMHVRAATLEWDVYRRQHRFPAGPFTALLVLGRTSLSTIMMLLYPVQTGKMRLTLCRQHADRLQALAAAFAECCAALGRVVRHNAPVAGALASLQRMEAAYVALMRGVLDAQRAAGGGPPNDRLALTMATSLLFTACTRVRRMHALLPEALGADQPGALAAVRRHFSAGREWDFAPLAQGSLQPGADTKRMVKASLVGPQSSTRGLVGKRLACTPEVQVSMRAPRKSSKRLLASSLASRVSRALRWVETRTGYSRVHLSLGVQLAVAYAIVMVLLVAQPAYNAVEGRSTWTVFIVIAIHEPLAGGATFKSILRFGGTIAGGALGLGALYFTYLCNGLSYDNRPEKFIVMTLVLTLLTMPVAAGTVRYGLKTAYFYLITCVTMYTTALPGYSHTEPMPKLALWRVVCTAIGIAVELLVSQLVFPVTARQTFRTLMARVLGGLSDVVDAAFHSVLPASDAEGSTHSGKGGPGGGKAARLPGAAPGEIGDAEAPRPLGEAVLSPLEDVGGGMKRVQSMRTLSAAPVHATLGDDLQHLIFGRVLEHLKPTGLQVAGDLVTMGLVLAPLRLEFSPFARPRRFPVEQGMVAARLCRRSLNVLTAFAITMDSHDTTSLPLLAPHAAALERLLAQVQEALRAMAAMVEREGSVAQAARVVAHVEAHLEQLLLRVAVQEHEAGISDSDVMQGLAFVAMLFSTSYAARLLCIALVRAFFPADPAALAEVEELSADPARWALDEKLALLAGEVLGAAAPAPAEPTGARGADAA